LQRVLFGRQRDPQRTQNSFFAVFFMVTSKLTRNTVVKLENKRKEIIEKNQNRINGWIDDIGLITVMTSPAFARSITFKEHGMALWIFIIIGAFIVLLQLIPAVIVFFSFIGTITAIVFKKESKVEEEVVQLGTEPVEVRRQGNIMRGEI